jgi:hypothetical protein
MKTTQSRLLCLGIIGGVVLFVGVMALTTPAGAISPPPPQMYRLNMTLNPIGGGHVAPSPNYEGGTFFGSVPTSWVEYYTSGINVALSAVPHVGHIFDHWEGDLSGIASHANLAMNSPKNVTAVFCPVDPGAPPRIAFGHSTVAQAADGTTSSTRRTVGAGELVDVWILDFSDMDSKCGEDIPDSRLPEGLWEIWENDVLLPPPNTTTNTSWRFALDAVGSYVIKYFANDRSVARGTTRDPRIVMASDGSMWAASESITFTVKAPEGVRYHSYGGSELPLSIWMKTDWVHATHLGIYDTAVNQVTPVEVSFSRCQVRELFRPTGRLMLGPFPSGAECPTTGEGRSILTDINTFRDRLNDGLFPKQYLIPKDSSDGEPVEWTGSVPKDGEKWCIDWRVYREEEDDEGFENILEDMTLITKFTIDGQGCHFGYLDAPSFPTQGPWKQK